MAGDDDIDRLLREVQALESGPSKAQPPAKQQGKAAQPPRRRRAREPHRVALPGA